MSESLPTPQGSRRGDEAESASSRRQLQRPTELPPEIAAKLEKRKRFPRARRCFFNGAVVLSLALFAGNYWLWVRGVAGWTHSWNSPRVAHWNVSIWSGSGNSQIGIYRVPPDMQELVDTQFMKLGFNSAYDSYGLSEPAPFSWFKISSQDGSATKKASYIFFSLPQWFLQLLFAVLPLWWLWRWAERRAEKKLARTVASQ